MIHQDFPIIVFIEENCETRKCHVAIFSEITA